MKMVIAGGRDFEGNLADVERIHKAVRNYMITEIVSGCANGADLFGEKAAEIMNIPVKRFPADWVRWKHMAGPIRNKQMAKYTDYVFLFYGGKGTTSMRNEAIKAGKKIIFDDGWCK